MHQQSLFGQPLPAARRTDPATSHDAAASIDVDTLRESQRQVLLALAALGGGTDGDIYKAICARNYLISPSGARTRRSELVAMGLVRDSGDKVRLTSGCFSIVWEVVR